MAKVKNKRNAGLADKVHNKKKSEIHKKKLNPFEVHINKEKLKVLGKKSKHDRGLPGVSRAKAIQKRKETLGTEMKLMNKTNTFIDRRIGERNNQLSAEDRMVARFAAERAKQHTKKNIYNLADDEILTHRGQTLEQIEKFDDPRSDDEDDDIQKFGGLDNDFVSEGHFGGGILSKTDAKDGAKSHKDLIEQLIAESKKRKAEKQKEKEQTLDLTEKLDSEWKDLQPVVFKKAKLEESAIEKALSEVEKKSEDYDKMTRELRFEKRGTPSDGLKSDEKLAKEEREKLQLWEKERELRMLGDEEVAPKVTQPTTKHRSADDLDDNFELEDEREFMLAYDKDGKPLVPEHILKDFSVPNSQKKFNDGVSDTSSEEGEDSDTDDDNNDQSDNEDEASGHDDNNVDIKESTKKDSDKGGLFQDSENDDNSEEEEDDEDDDDDSEKETETEIVQNVIKVTEQTIKTNLIEKNKSKLNKHNNSQESDSSEDGVENESEDLPNTGEDSKSLDKDSHIDDLKDLRESEDSDDDTDEERDEKIATFFDLKSTEGENLKELLTGKSPTQQSAALEKLIKSYDPSLSENNKDLLSRLFAHLLQYINDIFTGLKQESDVIKSFLIFDKLVPHIYDLVKTNKVSTKKFLAELLKEKHDKFQKHPKRVPDLDTLIFFKLVSILYPTSDFRHPITTPSLVFMTEILTLSKFIDGYSISRGLFVTSLILEYISLSKRLVPAAINFLRGVLYLSANTTILNPIQVVPPFRLHNDKILNLEDNCSKMDVDHKMAAKDLVTEIDTNFKIRCLITTCLMLKEFFVHCNDFEAQECIFESHIKLLNRIELDLYPKKMASMISEILKFMEESLAVKTFKPLCREKKKPKALRLYEPDVQEVFTGNKSSKLSREKADQMRLKTKYKKEMKGALREIRRDKAYIASVKIRQKIHSDNIRKEKVKQIYKDASLQQGELNKLKRMK